MPTSQLSVVAGNPEGRVSLSLLGGFSLRIANVPVSLPLHARRVIAYLSLDKLGAHDCDRRVLAERLWADSTSDRCRGSLRTALWRIRSADSRLIKGDSDRVWIADDVEVDVHRLRRQAERTLSEASGEPEHSQFLVHAEELLPGWDEDWLLLAREQLRQMRLHASEVTARRLRERERYTEAINVLLAVIAEEPLRESAQGLLIDAHLDEGNVFEARRQLNSYAHLLWTELQLRPSPELLRKVGLAMPV